MSAPPSNSTKTYSESDQSSAAQSAASISETISACAADATNRTEFLKLVSAELAVAFEVGIVAVELGEGAGPMMLVNDEFLGLQIDRASIRQILLNAGSAPVTCEIPLGNAGEAGSPWTRGMSVEIQGAPHRSAFLLLYSIGVAPPTVGQVHHLKQLGLYAEAIRNSLDEMPSDVNSDELIADEEDAQGSQLTSALRHRQSLQLFHQDLDVDATAYRIANESRRLLRCDRVTVLLPKSNRYRVRAMSGVAVIDSRSNSVRFAEGLVDSANVMERPLAFPSEEPLPPQILDPLDEYLDETGVSAAMMLPLHRQDPTGDADEHRIEVIDPFSGTGDIVAVLMLEYFSGDPPKSINPAISLVSSEAVLALQNSMEHRKVFGLRLWKSVGTAVQALRRPLIAFIALAIVTTLIALAVVPIEHQVIATGTSQPADQRQVFASVDGIVKKIHVTDGQQVKAGDAILELENAELESQAESITGEILTASQRLSSIRAIRLSGESDPNQSGRLVMEEGQLQSKLENLKAQQTLIKKQQANLLITSPIEGTIVAWQLDRRLSERPVSRGNLLVSVVDHSGPWLLRLTVPDQNAGPVLEAFEQSQSLPVRFAVATIPDASFAATLNSVSTATRLDQSGQHVIDVTATVQQSESKQAESLDLFARDDARVGADVTAKIACGQRTILRSWFSDVFDFVDRNVLFYFR